jgi:Common central domain of tyrosinase/Polyphenol oxidase middle domain/TAT (twin-arginine translocation) pathway signal sequence
MFSAFPSRRDFLKAAGTAAAALGVGRFASRDARSQPVVQVRHNIDALIAQNSPLIQSLRTGIAAMQARAPSDPTSWRFQANIHGTLDDDPQLNGFWNRCPHANFYFLSWHRMYLYWFERILRAASGDPTLTLPYWNYTEPTQRGLPLPFRDPADETANALFTPRRWAVINSDIVQLGGTAVRIDEALASTTFASALGQAATFGGVIVSDPSIPAQPGLLELTPHNIVHTIVGAGGNLMSDPLTAARDPIFWLHHANIDRLWVRWIALADGRENPVANVDWMTQPFTFFDENGQQVTMAAQDILDTQFDLEYRYDDDPERSEPLPALLVAGGPDGGAGPAGAGASAAAGEAPVPPAAVVLARTPEREAAPIALEERRTRVPVKAATASALDRFSPQEAMAPTSERTLLVLEDVKVPDHPGAYYEIYLNLPEGADQPDPAGEFFVGSLGLFMPVQRHGPEHALRFVYDITDVLRRQGRAGVVDPAELSVTFIKRGAVTRAGEEVLPEADGVPEISGIEITSVAAEQ